MSETLRKMISLGISRKSISNNFLAWLWVKLCNLDVFSQGKKLGGIGAPKNMILFASGGPKLHQMTIPKYLHGTEICTYMYITGWWFQIFFILGDSMGRLHSHLVGLPRGAWQVFALHTRTSSNFFNGAQQRSLDGGGWLGVADWAVTNSAHQGWSTFGNDWGNTGGPTMGQFLQRLCWQSSKTMQHWPGGGILADMGTACTFRSCLSVCCQKCSRPSS